MYEPFFLPVLNLSEPPRRCEEMCAWRVHNGVNVPTACIDQMEGLGAPTSPRFKRGDADTVKVSKRLDAMPKKKLGDSRVQKAPTALKAGPEAPTMPRKNVNARKSEALAAKPAAKKKQAEMTKKKEDVPATRSPAAMSARESSSSTKKSTDLDALSVAERSIEGDGTVNFWVCTIPKFSPLLVPKPLQRRRCLYHDYGTHMGPVSFSEEEKRKLKREDAELAMFSMPSKSEDRALACRPGVSLTKSDFWAGHIFTDKSADVYSLHDSAIPSQYNTPGLHFARPPPPTWSVVANQIPPAKRFKY